MYERFDFIADCVPYPLSFFVCDTGSQGAKIATYVRGMQEARANNRQFGTMTDQDTGRANKMRQQSLSRATILSGEELNCQSVRSDDLINRILGKSTVSELSVKLDVGLCVRSHFSLPKIVFVNYFHGHITKPIVANTEEPVSLSISSLRYVISPYTPVTRQRPLSGRERMIYAAMDNSVGYQMPSRCSGITDGHRMVVGRFMTHRQRERHAVESPASRCEKYSW
jgi:hypothetical protein